MKNDKKMQHTDVHGKAHTAETPKAQAHKAEAETSKHGKTEAPKAPGHKAEKATKSEVK